MGGKNNSMDQTPYRQLAARLDALPNGFPPTPDGIELRLLAKLFTPDEAALAAQLRMTLETPDQIAARTGGDAKALRQQLKALAKRGLISIGRTEYGLGYGLMPFVVGFYEMQGPTIDAELAQLFEDYYRQALGPRLADQPQVHRVLPVNESVPVDIAIEPYESAAAIVNKAQAWGVVDCICRKQKALVGDPCEHPVEICLTLGDRPGMFDHSAHVRALTREEALAKLQEAADAGLVHTVGNHQREQHYICNCCTCSCGILRGISDLGIANAAARSAFVSVIDPDTCTACESCLDYCQFNALALNDAGLMEVEPMRCTGCGQCVVHCPDDAPALVRRPEHEIKPVPATEHAWGEERAAARGIHLEDVL
jgi:Pyruvate/2-oxoacid:ferredoxin oxidoreductase delta subunit